MASQILYTKKRSSLSKAMDLVEDLDNRIFKRDCGIREENSMPKRMRDKVVVNGNTFWIDGYSNQELHEAYVDLLEREGLLKRIDPDEVVPLLRDYISIYYSTYKTKQQQNTIVNRERVIKNHIIPRFGECRVDQITTKALQRWFNELSEQYSRETIIKIKNTLNPVLDSAVEDDYISKNPLKSKRLEIHGRDTVSHKAIPKEKMDEIKATLPVLEPRLMLLGGLLAYTGMRFEEVLGCRYEDFSGGMIHIRRAVVHPKRNQPEVKAPKTKTSIRTIPCPQGLFELLKGCPKKGFLLYSFKDETRETPLSYMESRRAYEKLQKLFDIPDYTPHDFRDTCATEWRERGMPLDVISRLLGHSKTETTEKRYVKYREDLIDAAKNLM